MATPTSSSEERDDFKPLKEAASVVSRELKLDENDANDLYYQLRETPSNDSHQYFIEPYKNTWGPMLECGNFIEMPAAIREQYQTLQVASYMGIFPEISRVWVTVDNRLYLWDYENPNNVIFPYEALDNVIIAVSLCTPRPGLFLDRVKYVLVISTAVEIVILALSWEDGPTQNFRVHQSPYTISSDDVPMIKIVSAQNGRIFMGGKDGNLYELIYENQSDTWRARIGIGEQHKCYKINHTSWHIENLVPSVLKGLMGWEQSVQDLAVDSIRGLVYVLTSTGNIYVMYMGIDGTTSQILSCSVNVFSSERNSLAQHSTVVSMEIISPLEAKGVHLLIILSTGTRLYYTVFDGYHEPFNPTSVHSSRVPSPVEFSLTAPPRYPPNSSSLLRQLNSDHSAGSTDGLPPVAGSILKLQTKSAFYSHGVTIAELRPDGQSGNRSTTLVGFTQDWSRHNLASNATDRRVNPSLREACTMLPLSHPNLQPSVHGDVHDIKEVCGQLHDIELSRLRAMYSVSRTAEQRPPPVKHSPPPSFGLFGRASVDSRLAPEPPPGTAQCSAYAGRARGSGIALDDKSSILQLGELVWQHLPCPSSPQRRELLVLTSYGLHYIRKNRPVDYLWRILASASQPSDMQITAEQFFQAFGYTESCAMCLGIACGLPCDVGDGSVVSRQYEEIKRRAMSLLQQFGEANSPPSAPGVFRGPSFSPSHNALASFASRVLRPVWSRSLISSHSSTSISDMSSAGNIVSSSGLFDFRNQNLQFFLRLSDIGNILQPLIYLEGILVNYFGPSIRVCTSRGGAAGDYESNRANGIVRMINFQQEQGSSQAADAKTKENQSLHGLYLLICRSAQALKLFQILMRREEENASIKVRWGLLKNKLFQDLVISPAVHGDVRRLLNNLLADLSAEASDATSRASRERLLLIAEKLSTEFSTHCDLYFSPGARHLYEGRKYLANAKNAPFDSQERADFLSEAGQHLCEAARYWRSMAEVSDDGAVLGEICDEVLSLGGDGPLIAIDLCLAAASNFGSQLSGRRGSSHALNGLEGSRSHPQQSFHQPSGRELYHASGVSGADNILRAKHCCYERIITCLRRVRIGPNLLGAGEVNLPMAELKDRAEEGPERDLVREMISYAVQQTGDYDFHRQLYEYLLESDREQLIYVESRHIEDFLRESDTNLLYRHFKYHSLFAEAAYLMDLQAHSGETAPLEVYSLPKRIEYLEKAVVCTDQAIRTRGFNDPHLENVAVMYNHEKLQSLRDELDLANVQLCIFNTLDTEYSAVKDLAASAEGKRKIELLKSKIDELGSTLCSSSSDLYNITHSYHLWNYSLMLLHICKHEDSLLVENLWKSIVYRKIPKDNVDVDRYLKNTFGGCFRDKRRERPDVAFEDYQSWIPELRAEIVDLSQKLGGADNRTYFPLLKLVEYLELVTAEVSFGHLEGSGELGESVGRSWVHRCLIDDVGVRLSELAECYMTTIHQQVTGKQDKVKLQLYHSAAAILLEWVRVAATNSRRHHEDVQNFYLHRVKYRQWLEELQRLLKQSMDAKDVEGKNIYREAQRNLNQSEEQMKALLLR